MPDISWEVTEHALRLVLGSKPAKQRLRRFDNERRRAIGEEVAKLLAARFIKVVYHSNWLANPILVKRRSENGECALIILASTRHVRRTIFLCRA